MTDEHEVFDQAAEDAYPDMGGPPHHPQHAPANRRGRPGGEREADEAHRGPETSYRHRGHSRRPAPTPSADDTADLGRGARPPEPPPKPRDRARLPDGYRSSRRATRAGRANRRDVARFRMRLKAMSAGQQALVIGAGVLGGLALALLVLWGVATAVNVLSRWYIRSNAGAIAAARRHEQARDNVLIIGVKDGKAGGYLAARIEVRNRKVWGIAIPEGAFVEVPGQGFEKIGDAYSTAGDKAKAAATAKAAVSNYLSVPFERFIAVPYDSYQNALRTQSIAGITDQVLDTDLPSADLKVLGATASVIPNKDVAFVPLPVKPITVGSEHFLQPQRQQVADLLQSIWGVKAGPERRVRVIVENGSGTPGIAGAAAQQLIAAGFSVVDTKNAPSFGRKDTLILLYKGPAQSAQRLRDLLKVGTIKKAVSDQDLADIIVLIGKDYAPPGK